MRALPVFAASVLVLGVSAVAAAVPASAGEAHDWSGAYAGLSGGYGIRNTKADYSYETTAATAPPGFEDVFGDCFLPGYLGNECNGTTSLHVDGKTAVESALIDGFIPADLGDASFGHATAGAQLGFNQQFGYLVAGAEADVNWMGGQSSARFLGSALGANEWNFIDLSSSVTQKSSIDWMGTLRGRLGFAAGDVLFYGTGGLAFASTSASTEALITDNTVPNTNIFSGGKDGMKLGYVVGGGAEYALTEETSLRAEYLYYNLGSSSYDVAPANDLAAGQGVTMAARQRFDGSLIRIGLNIHF